MNIHSRAGALAGCLMVALSRVRGRYRVLLWTWNREAARLTIVGRSMSDLIGSPEHEEVRRKLAQRPLEFAEETADPVLPELREMLGTG